MVAQTENLVEDKPRRRWLSRLRRRRREQQPEKEEPSLHGSSEFEEENLALEKPKESGTLTPPCTPPPKKNLSLKKTFHGGRQDIPPPIVADSKLPVRSFVKLESPPTARDSAFSGPPRYDWIDIETSAAIKVQAAYRRNLVLKQLEEQGLSTVATRNRARRRNKKPSVLDGNMFSCCGMGLAFGGDDEYNHREHDREEYNKRQEERRAREEVLRSNYGKSHLKQRYQKDVDEAVEIVE